MTIREMIEETEERNLSKYALLSKNSKGRAEKIEPCDIRSEFQRDRDRIIHSKAFRRLKHKTQVFITPEGDHYRTRLTHTLEVSQIARTIARALRLNEDLVEAISLGHDLGHTPFGHAGENALDKLYKNGFRHNEQSIRVVEKLEKLNLTYEVRDGILMHNGDDQWAETLEGHVVKFADRIAYINHDIDDAIRAEILSKEDIPKELSKVLGDTHGRRIDTMIRDIITNSMDKNCICMSDEIWQATNELRQFMFEKVYIDSTAKIEESKVFGVIEGLYTYYINNPNRLPEQMRSFLDEQDVGRTVCDYIASMSDRFALYVYEELYIPKSWKKL